MADISSITLPGGGTYDLKDKNAVPKYGMGKNLLDNWYFLNPVNQRGLTNYPSVTSGGRYTIDRWLTNSRYVSVSVSNVGVVIKNNHTNSQSDCFHQNISVSPDMYTLSVMLSDGSFYTRTQSIQSSSVGITLAITNTASFGATTTNVRLILGAGEELSVKVIKLELGTEQTLAHQENGTWVLNEIPDYEEELIKCQTSTADPSDTYANKSLATEQQLAYVESGTTASRAYSVGEYFCWNGLLYQAKTAISIGASFTPGTNCEQAPGGGINRVWKDNYESTTFSSLVNCNSCSTPLAVYQTLMASSKAVGYGEIGNQQTSQLKSFLTNPYANYTSVTFEFISAGLIRCTARNASDGSILGKVCYLKGTINNLSSAWTVTEWEDVDGAIGHKEVTLTTATLRTSFSPTSRMIGNASTLFGVAAEKILSIIPRDNVMSPASNLVCGFYNGNFYLAATQECTLSSSVKFNITYIK